MISAISCMKLSGVNKGWIHSGREHNKLFFYRFSKQNLKAIEVFYLFYLKMSTAGLTITVFNMTLIFSKSGKLMFMEYKCCKIEQLELCDTFTWNALKYLKVHLFKLDQDYGTFFLMIFEAFLK